MLIITACIASACGNNNDAEDISAQKEQLQVEKNNASNVSEEDGTEQVDLSMVYAGDIATSIIDSKGNLLICGNNQKGQLGDEIPSNKPTYSLVAKNIKYVCGASSFAAISTDNILYAWGYNGYGQLGDERESDINPELIKVDDDVKDVSITSNVCAYVTLDGKLYMMGTPRVPFGDEKNTISSNEPVKILDDIKDVELSSNLESGNIFAAITNDNELYMWGSNDDGIIDPDSSGVIATPTKVMDNVQMVSLGDDYVLVLNINNELFAWGKSGRGQLGVSNSEDDDDSDAIIDIDNRVKVLENVVFTDSGSSESLAITENGDLYTWGYNAYGCLGIGKDFDLDEFVDQPTKIMENVRSASIDGSTMSVLTQSGDVYTCGWNVVGQLGTGSFDDSNVPVKVYNVYTSDLPKSLKDENAGTVQEEYFDNMDDVLISTEGNGQNMTVDMTIDHLSDFVKYNGGRISLQLSDGNIAIMFEYEVEDNVASNTNIITVLTNKGGSLYWEGAGWDGTSCEQNNDLLSWNCILPDGSFSFEEVKYIGVSVYTSRSRQHVTTYEIDEGELRPIEKTIEQMDVAVPSTVDHHQYIE